uniref:ABC transporter domain-containing protein n=1 Tax=Alexandrium catenella TaxID=2925 RepID=A0A7S1SCD1_ALECA
MIQYNVQVSSGDNALESEATPLPDEQSSFETQHDGSALKAAQDAAAATSVEFQKLSIALRALTARSSCAEHASGVLPHFSAVLEEVALLRAKVEAVVEKSAECEAAEDKDMVLLSIKADTLTSDDADSEAPADSGTFDGSSAVPHRFDQWHTGRFSEGFRGQWQSIADLSRKKEQDAPLVNLNQRPHCVDQADAGSQHRGVHLATDAEKAATEELFETPLEQLPVAMPFGFGGGSHDYGSSNPADVSSSITSAIGRNASSSKWDAIMKNGFKQMSKMMQPQEQQHKAPVYLLFVFIVLAILIIVAILLVSRPLITMGQDPVESTGKEPTRSAFVQVALVYWLPVTPKSKGIVFFSLFASLLVTSLGVNFFVGCAFLRLLKHSDPKIAMQVEKAKIFNSEYLQILAGFACVVAPITFFIFRRDLAGRWRQWRYLIFKIYLLFEGQILSIVGGYMARMQMNNVAAMDADAFWHCCRGIQMVMIVIGIFDAFVSGYVDNVLSLDWRRFLAEYMLASYMGGHSFYKMNSNSGKDDGADNPDQRMQSDVETFATSLDTFVFSILKTIMTLISSTIIVWSIIPRLTMILLGYCCVGSLISLYFCWRFVQINYKIQKLEADYRYSMVHIRDNAEGIAMYGGENEGQGEVNDRFHELLRWKYNLIMWNISFNAFQFFYTSLGDIFPLILLSQRLFQGKIDFGAMGQVGGNFTSVMSSLSFINKSVTLMSSLGTSTNRLTGMLNKIDALQGGEEITFITSNENRVELKDVCVKTPDDRPLVQHLSFAFTGKGAARLLVVGRSGVGKSSLMRTLAGLWSQGSGEVTMPPKGDCMFLPQKPYMPLGCLRKQLCYPAVGHAANDADLRSMLEELGLGDLPDRFEDGFDSVRDWARVLSLGEQQRVAAIRAMIHQPAMVVLDESTSALSLIDENLVYKRFGDLNISYISVGHRMTIIKFHDQVLELLVDNGAYKIHTRAEYQQILEKQPSSP